MYKEMKQLDNRTCYLPLKVDEMTIEEKVKKLIIWKIITAGRHRAVRIFHGTAIFDRGI